MADVTDAAFRRIIAKYSGDAGLNGFKAGRVLYTEFVSADGLCHPKGREKLLVDLQYDESERPIVAQLFSANPEKMEAAAKLVTELGFDGLDINMGCPDRTIEKQGAGAALIKNPKLARELIRAARQGVGTLPVSVKTRLGYSRDELETWLPALLAEKPAAITIHARTRKEMSKAPARWERIRRAVEIRDGIQLGVLASKSLIIGNGDVEDLADARKKAAETGADGIMLGRAIFGNPFLFSKKKCPEGFEGLKLRLRVLVEHTKLFEQLLGEHKSFAIMKKHFKAYLSGVAPVEKVGDWHALREQLMAAPDAMAVEQVVHNYLALL